MLKCPICNGIGLVAFRNNSAPGLSSVLTANCSECDGIGKVFYENHERCFHCGSYTDECQCNGGYA
jgi:DnaJ-class molecular chaperone